LTSKKGLQPTFLKNSTASGQSLKFSSAAVKAGLGCPVEKVDEMGITEAGLGGSSGTFSGFWGAASTGWSVDGVDDDVGVEQKGRHVSGRLLF
jgi:hypothetical protein